MTRMLKYMVYNPLRDKPKAYYNKYDSALNAARQVSAISGEDVLVLKVIAKVETKIQQDIQEIIKELR